MLKQMEVHQMTKPIEQRAKRPPMASVREAPFNLVRSAPAAGEPDDGLTLDGYGAVFNSPAIIDSWEGRFREIIAPGSMKRSFRETPPKIQYDHGRHPLIGSIPIASLRSITEDADPVLAPDGGAHVVGRIFDNWLMQPVRDAIASDPPAINGMSFRFEVVRESWAYADGSPIKDDKALVAELDRTWLEDVPDDELPIRTMKELKVPEIGPVMWPAYESTSVSVRNKVIDLGRLNEPEQRNLLARAVFIADGLPEAGRDAAAPAADDPAEGDDDPAQLAGALDAILDEAGDLLDGVDLSTLPADVAQACNLLVAAETVADQLLEAMGVFDPDDDEANEPRSKNIVGIERAINILTLTPGLSMRDEKPDPTKNVDAQQVADSADERPSRKIDAQQSTGSKPVGEHPSKRRHPVDIALGLRTVRSMMNDINNREVEQ
jgi:phage head maturation protease